MLPGTLGEHLCRLAVRAQSASRMIAEPWPPPPQMPAAPTEPVPAAPKGPTQEELLTDIRELLKTRSA